MARTLGSEPRNAGSTPAPGSGSIGGPRPDDPSARPSVSAVGARQRDACVAPEPTTLFAVSLVLPRSSSLFLVPTAIARRHRTSSSPAVIARRLAPGAFGPRGGRRGRARRFARSLKTPSRQRPRSSTAEQLPCKRKGPVRLRTGALVCAIFSPFLCLFRPFLSLATTFQKKNSIAACNHRNRIYNNVSMVALLVWRREPAVNRRRRVRSPYVTRRLPLTSVRASAPAFGPLSSCP